MHFDAAACINIYAIALLVILTNQEEHIACTSCRSITVANNSLDIVAKGNKQSGPGFQSLVTSFDYSQEVSKALAKFFICANFIPTSDDFAALGKIDLECYQDRV